MSNPDASENKTAQSTKGRNQKPVPRFMSLTWLRLHMKIFIYLVVATFVISLFFIGYGTILDYRSSEKNEEDYRKSITNEANVKYGLPNALKDKGDLSAVTLTYNNSSYTSSIDVKTIYRNLKNNEASRVTKEDIINHLIQLNILGLYAKSKNLVQESSIDAAIQREKEVNAKNNSNEFEYNLIRNGLTLDEYKQQKLLASSTEAALRNSIVRVSAASATEDYLKSYYESHKLAFKKENQISFDNLLISPNVFEDTSNITDEQVNAYYEEHKSEFMTSKMAEVSQIFIKVNDSDFLSGIDVDEAEIKTLYENSKRRFTEPEQVKARHILIKPRGEGDDEKKFEEAKNVIQAIYEKVKNGEDFAKLATENSEDTGSAVKGGDLGYFSRGKMVKEFEKVAFSSEVGAISEPVRTQFGYHIIKVEDKKPEIVKSYEEVKDQLVREKREDLADQIAESKLTEVYFDVFGNKNNAPKFLKYVKQFTKDTTNNADGKLPLFFKGDLTEDYSDADRVILKDAICDGTETVATEIEKAVFAFENYENSFFPCFTDVVKTQEGYHIFMISGFAQPIQRKLTDSLKQEIKDIISKKHSDEEAKKIAESLIKENASSSIDVLVKAYGKETSERKHTYTELPFNEDFTMSNGYELFDGLGQFSFFTSKGSEYLPEFHEKILEAIKANNFNTYLTPFKSQFGWHIVKVIEYKKDLYDSFEDVRNTIRHIVTFEPSDAEINKYFEDNKARFAIQATRTIRQIVCGSLDAESASKDSSNNTYYKETIDKAYKELETGAAFSLVARKYSTDPSSQNGGLMPAMTKGSYDTDFDNAVWSLEKVGDYTKPIQKDDGSWAIGFLESETKGTDGSLTPQVINSIKAMYIEGYQREAVNYFLKELMNQTKVERNQELIDLIK